MHFFTSLTVLCSVASRVFAAPTATEPSKALVVKRDYKTVTGILGQVSKDLDSLTAKVKDFDGQAINAVPVLDAAAAALKTLKDGAVTVQGQNDLQKDVLSLVDTIFLLGSLNTLNTAVDNVTKNLVAKKEQFDQALVGFVVSDQLVNFQGAAKGLVDAVVAKLPAYLPTVLAQVFYQPILTKLDNAVKAFPNTVT